MNDSMEVDDVTFVRLKTSDGKLFSFTESEASCSTALKRMLDITRQSTSNHASQCIHLQTIDSRVLSNIHQWCKMHSIYNQSSVSNNINSSTNSETPNSDYNTQVEEYDPEAERLRRLHKPTWDMKFLASFSELDLLKLTNAANFLDIKLLYDACCKYIAIRWESMKVEEIRRAYHIRNDFTSEEEHQIIQENKRIGQAD